MRSQIDAMETEGYQTEVAILTNNSSPKGILRNIRIWKSNIRQLSPCIVHAQYGSVTSLTAAWCKGSNPLVISFCGDDILGTKQTGWTWTIRSRLMVWISHISAFYADALIAKSSNIYNTLWPAEQKKCTIIPNGVDLNTFAHIDYATARKQCRWRADDFVVLFNPSSGNNAYVKNKPLADAVFNLLKQQVPKAQICFIENKTYTEINCMMHGADALLVTSLQEGSPNIVKEAMACNLPVVSVNCGDVAERLKEVQPSVVTTSYDARELANNLVKISQLRMRSNGRNKLIMQSLTIENTNNKLIKIYKILF